jgi:hypothetical protein
MTKARLDKIATIEDLAQVARRRIPNIGLANAIWPGTDQMLAAAAANTNVP